MSAISDFKSWLVSNGGQLHDGVAFNEVPSGNTIVAKAALPADTTVVSCPFSLAITPKLALDALTELLPRSPVFATWTERQLICTYIALHWITAPQPPSALKHLPYLNTLPSRDALRTPLHFTDVELEAFRGTNLYGATVDRKTEWNLEWEVCQQGVIDVNKTWGDSFFWEHYLTAATYLSSRAFPSTLLSPTPSLEATKESHPILLPGVDSLNHKRGTPVSWEVDYPTDGSKREPLIKLTLHSAHEAGAELFNNYGAKPNAELILGYGFAVERNEDDTIVLRIGGADDASDDESESDDEEDDEEEKDVKGKGKGKAVEGKVDDDDDDDEDDSDYEDDENTKRWDVGRGASGADALWTEVVKLVGMHGVERDECGCGHDHGEPAAAAAESSHSHDHSGHSHDHEGHSHDYGGHSHGPSSEETVEEMAELASPTWEGELDASSVLMGMVIDVLSRLPTIGRTEEDMDEEDKVRDKEQKENRLRLRPEVLAMLTHYVQGQRDVLESLLQFAKGKEEASIASARADGVELDFEDDDEEEVKVEDKKE